MMKMTAVTNSTFDRQRYGRRQSLGAEQIQRVKALLESHHHSIEK